MVVLLIAPAQKLSKSLLRKVWLITPNETEASLLSGIEVIDAASGLKAAEQLLKLGIKNVIITLGENGSLLCDENGSEQFKAFKVQAADSTAAGDVFNGTLAVAITKDESLQNAINFAAAAAAISVTREGAQPSIPTRFEIDDFLTKYKAI